MKSFASIAATTISVSSILASVVFDTTNGALVKMCLFYKPSGHARTDPILSQECVSDHVHTFYGPQLFHPSTSPEDLRNSDPKFSTSGIEENKSLYWHPSIYKVGKDAVSGETTYELAEISFSGPYYRWDRDAPAPMVEAFPPGFQMIAGMDPTVSGLNLFSECLCPKPCTRADGLCESPSEFFPSEACGEMGIAMAFPTCWDDSKGLGDTGDHMSHMAYTLDGTVAGECPEGYNRRLPQIQLFVRVANYEGGHYTFSDNTLPGDEEVFHADFMNGWDEGVLEDIVENCNPLPGADPDDYNPECTCDQFLTVKSDILVPDVPDEEFDEVEAAKICPIDVRAHIVDEEINFGLGGLPRGSCSAPVITGVPPPFVSECGLKYTPNLFEEESCDGSEDEGDEDSGESGENEDEDEDESEDENESEEDEFEDDDESEDWSEDEENGSEEWSEDEDESKDWSEDEEFESEDGSKDDGESRSESSDELENGDLLGQGDSTTMAFSESISSANFPNFSFHSLQTTSIALGFLFLLELLG